MVADMETLPILGADRTESSSASSSSEKMCEEDSGSESRGWMKGVKETTGRKLSFSWTSHRARGTFVLLGVSNMAACMCFSLLAPFFPAQAQDKNISPIGIGLVFSCYEFVVFASSIVFGKFLYYLGMRTTFIAGQFALSACTVLFGLAYLTPSGAPFLATCLVLRTVQALGASAFFVACVPLIAQEFPNYVATVFGTSKVFNGIGYMLGPLIGGALFEVGGFGLPFYVVGAMLLGCFVSTFFLLPESPDQMGEEKKPGGSSASVGVDSPFRSLLLDPLILLAIFTVMVGAYSIAFYESSAAVYMEEFNMSAVSKGAMFIIVSILYSVLSPLFGWISDNKNITYPFLILGNFTLFVSLLLVGPSPWLPFLNKSLGLTVISYALLGIGLAATVVPVLTCFYVAARRLGLKEGACLDGLLSGILNSSFHFGAFVGPVLGNTVTEAYDYKSSTTLNAVLCLVNGIAIVAYVILEKTCCKYEESSDVIAEMDVTGLLSKQDYKNGTVYSAISQHVGTEMDSQ